MNNRIVCFSKAILLTAVILFIGKSGFAAEINKDSVIREVTVYPGAALITREVDVKLVPGEHSVVIKDVVPQMDENSLTVSGKGTSNVKIFGAQIKKEYLQQTADGRVKELEAEIESLNDQITAETNNQRVLDEEREFLRSIKLFAGDQIPKDLVTNMPSAEELGNTLNFLTAKLRSIEQGREEIRINVRDLQRKRDALTRELNNLRSYSRKMQRSIVVDLECSKDGSLKLNISYLVYGVYWRPVYDARVNFDKKEVDLTSFAFIKQSTGEDWVDVNLTISTSKPTVGGRMPELASWYLNPYQAYQRQNKARHQVLAKATMMGGEFREESFDYAANAPMEALELNDAQVVYAEIDTAGANIVYKIQKPITIKSDGTEHRVGVTAQVLPVKFEYATTPKLSAFAYLRSEVSNNQEGQLLPGRVNIFLDGSYVGTSDINKMIGTEEKFDLYLGVDESITVKRELLEKKTDDILIGGIKSPNKTTKFTYKITAENYKPGDIAINVFDQIPVSQDEKIRVKDIKFRLKPTEEDYRDRQGVVLWSFSLKPKETKEIEFSFTVEHPRELAVSGL